MNILRLTTRILKYELRSKQWYVNAFAIVLVTALMTLFYSYSDRLNVAIKTESAHILGGDLALVSPDPAPASWEKKARASGLKVASVWTLQTVARVNNQFQLINLQAVSDQYPLVSSAPLSITRGSVLVEPRLLVLLNIKLNDRLQIGDGDFIVSGLLTPDTDSLSTGFNISPRVMMNSQDLAKTNILLPGSRVDYRLLYTGSATQLKDYIAWIKPKLKAGQRLLDINAQEFILNKTVSNIFLVFEAVILLTLLLCVIAVIVNTREYVDKHIHFVALWRTLGATKTNIMILFVLQVLIVVAISVFIGVIIAIIISYPIDYAIITLSSRTLPPTAEVTFLRGALSGVVLFGLTVWMPILSLASVSAKQIFTRKVALSYKQFRYALYLNIAAIFIYLYLFINFTLFALFFLCAVTLSMGVLLVATDSIISVLRYLARFTNGTLRRGIYFLVQHADSTTMQLSAFSLIGVFLTSILFLQNNLLADFANSWSKDKPNYFIYNIADTDLPGLQAFLKENHIKSEAFYPILRGRLVAINNAPLQSGRVDWGHNALQRELNLTSSASYPSDNVVIMGGKNPSVNPVTISIEDTLAQALSVKLNDELTFQISDKTLTGKIASVRTVKWASLHPNFYVIFSPGAFAGFETPYLSSMYIPTNQQDLLLKLIERFPSVTLIDISSIMNQIQQLIDYAALIIKYLFIAVTMAAILVVWSSVLAVKAERDKTKRLLVTLGASKSYIRKSTYFQVAIMVVIVVTISIPLTYFIYEFGLLKMFVR